MFPLLFATILSLLLEDREMAKTSSSPTTHVLQLFQQSHDPFSLAHWMADRWPQAGSFTVRAFCKIFKFVVDVLVDD